MIKGEFLQINCPTGQRAVAGLFETVNGWYFFDLGWTENFFGFPAHHVGILIEETEEKMVFRKGGFDFVLTELKKEKDEKLWTAAKGWKADKNDTPEDMINYLKGDLAGDVDIYKRWVL